MIFGHINKGLLSSVFAATKTFTGFEGPEHLVRHQLVVGGNENVQATNSAAVGTSGFAEKEKSEKSKRLFEQLIAQAIEAHNKAINGIIHQYEAMAEWYRFEAAKSGAAMEQIAKRMGENSEFIEGVDEIFSKYSDGNHFDREKALELLRIRGITVDHSISDQKLGDLLWQQKVLLLKNNSDLDERYKEQSKQKEEFERKAREVEVKGQELKTKQEAINNNQEISDEEKGHQLQDLQNGYSKNVELDAADANSDREAAIRRATDIEKTFEDSASADLADDFLAGLDSLKSAPTAVKGQFASAAANEPDRTEAVPEDNAEKKIAPSASMPGTRMG